MLYMVSEYELLSNRTMADELPNRSAQEDKIVCALIAVRWDLRVLCWNINEFMGRLFFLIMHRVMQGIQARGNIKL